MRFTTVTGTLQLWLRTPLITWAEMRRIKKKNLAQAKWRLSDRSGVLSCEMRVLIRLWCLRLKLLRASGVLASEATDITSCRTAACSNNPLSEDFIDIIFARLRAVFHVEGPGGLGVGFHRASDPAVTEYATFCFLAGMKDNAMVLFQTFKSAFPKIWQLIFLHGQFVMNSSDDGLLTDKYLAVKWGSSDFCCRLQTRMLG